ncbi:MAG: non-ribosomal peptide synthetase, partial [bacterium]|nr:non-ribosomal peptide synthetase [bacterium]
RGFRIEPGEIESLLLKHENINEAVVVVYEPASDPGKPAETEKYICAYIVSGKELSIADLRNELSKQLPNYMIPSYFMQLEKIPLTHNGKIDRKALPTPEIKTASQYTAPRSIVEETLARLWREVLTMDEPVGIDDNFFEMGGHSLKATILATKIHKTLEVQLPLAEIFKAPTIREMAQYINRTGGYRFISIPTVEKKQYYPLSSAQQRLYVLQQMDLESTVYNIPTIITLENEPDCHLLQESFIKLIKRHESLRTSFHQVNETPAQIIHDEVEFKIENYDRAESAAIESSSQVNEQITRFIRPFDLTRAPLLRAGLIKTTLKTYVLVVDMHHIVSDGTSIEILERDFKALGNRQELPSLTIHYKDYSQWQHHEHQKENIARQEKYWLKQFEHGIPDLNLPADYPRPEVRQFEGGILSAQMDCDTGFIKKIAMENRATAFMVMLAFYYIFLYKISSREDIVVGTPVAGRRHADLEPVIGMFVNTLALRNQLDGENTFTGILKKVRKTTLDAFDNQDYQFEDLVEKVALHRDRHNPLFDVMFAWREWDPGEIENIGDDNQNEDKTRTPQEIYTYEQKTAKFDLTLGIDLKKKLAFSFEYSTTLFKKETIERYAANFKEIISAVLKNDNIKIKDIQLTALFADTELGTLQEELSDMEF